MANVREEETAILVQYSTVLYLVPVQYPVLVGCEVRPCDPCARVRPCVPCVPCVSRLPPVSFYRVLYQ